MAKKPVHIATIVPLAAANAEIISAIDNDPINTNTIDDIHAITASSQNRE